MPVIPASPEEAKIRRIPVQTQPEKAYLENTQHKKGQVE
jgi:hypothetical protein